jgi:hypothetical protein
MEANPTGLYNISFLQDTLLHLDKILGGRISRAAKGTTWVEEGGKILQQCFMELRRTLRNSTTFQRHPPWMKTLLDKMQMDPPSTLGGARENFFGRQLTLRSPFSGQQSSRSGSAGSGISTKSPTRSQPRKPLLRGVSTPEKVPEAIGAIMDGDVDSPPVDFPPVSDQKEHGNAFYDVCKGMACLVDECGHAFSNQYTCKGELREYTFYNGTKAELFVKDMFAKGSSAQQHHFAADAIVVGDEDQEEPCATLSGGEDDEDLNCKPKTGKAMAKGKGK